jgi:hypothetical protein
MDVHSLSDDEASSERGSSLYFDGTVLPYHRPGPAPLHPPRDPNMSDWLAEDDAEDGHPSAVSYVVREALPLFATTTASPMPDRLPQDAGRPLPFYRDTNLLVIVDLSVLRVTEPSRHNDVLQTRVRTAQSALSNLLHAYGMVGDVRVAIAAFANGAVLHCPWHATAPAIASLDSLRSQHIFNGADPIECAQDAWSAIGQPAESAQNIAYFMSEGRSGAGDGIGEFLSDAEKCAWNHFLHGAAAACDRVFAVSFDHYPVSP